MDISTHENPDISIYIQRQTTNELVCVIEICRSKYLKKNTDKVFKMMENIQTMKEGYVIDFENFVMYKVVTDNENKFKRKEVYKIELLKLKIDNVIKNVKADLNIK